jgi:hypothetical protein
MAYCVLDGTGQYRNCMEVGSFSFRLRILLHGNWEIKRYGGVSVYENTRERSLHSLIDMNVALLFCREGGTADLITPRSQELCERLDCDEAGLHCWWVLLNDVVVMWTR